MEWLVAWIEVTHDVSVTSHQSKILMSSAHSHTCYTSHPNRLTNSIQSHWDAALIKAGKINFFLSLLWGIALAHRLTNPLYFLTLVQWINLLLKAVWKRSKRTVLDIYLKWKTLMKASKEGGYTSTRFSRMSTSSPLWRNIRRAMSESFHSLLKGHLEKTYDASKMQ